MSTYSNRLQPALFFKTPITTCCSVLLSEIVMQDDAYIGGRSENNISASCMTISGVAKGGTLVHFPPPRRRTGKNF